MTTPLVEFLVARIAEDEAVAREAAGRNGAQWGTHKVLDGATVTGELRQNSNPRAYGEDDALWDDEGALGMWEETASHIARHDPARVLAECEAKRRIAGMHESGPVLDHWEYECTCGFENHRLSQCRGCGAVTFEEGDWDWGHRPGPCSTLRLLALPYAGHPDYQPEWRLSDSPAPA